MLLLLSKSANGIHSINQERVHNNTETKRTQPTTIYITNDHLHYEEQVAYREERRSQRVACVCGVCEHVNVPFVSGNSEVVFRLGFGMYFAVLLFIFSAEASFMGHASVSWHPLYNKNPGTEDIKRKEQIAQQCANTRTLTVISP